MILILNNLNSLAKILYVTESIKNLKRVLSRKIFVCEIEIENENIID